MKSKKEQKHIEAENKKIEEAVGISQLMDTSSGKTIKRDLLLLEKRFRFQDVLGIKDEAVKDQKGIVLGVQQVQSYFDDIEIRAKQPRRDPITGKPEIMNAKK